MEQHEKARHQLDDRAKRLVAGELAFTRLRSRVKASLTIDLSTHELEMLCEYVTMLQNVEKIAIYNHKAQQKDAT